MSEQWKVGDKVRLTGREWPLNPVTRWKLGSVHEITGIFRGGAFNLDNNPFQWGTLKGWEIELVERAEEKKMSIDISEVNVGDKVKLTRANGDEATFTVTNHHRDYLETEHNTYGVETGDTLEILEKKFELVPGIYSDHRTFERVIITPDGKAYYTAHNGSFVPVPGEGSTVKKAVQEKGYWDREIAF